MIILYVISGGPENLTLPLGMLQLHESVDSGYKAPLFYFLNFEDYQMYS